MAKVLCELVGKTFEFLGGEKDMSSDCPDFSSLQRCEKNSCGYPCLAGLEYLESSVGAQRSPSCTPHVYAHCAHH